MKTLLIIATLCFVGCAPADNAVKTSKWSPINIDGSYSLNYRVVVIDGNEYFALWNVDGITLCPRLPPKH